jgi:hypothetical protein
MTSSTHTLIVALRQMSHSVDTMGVDNDELAETAERMETMQRLLDRAVDIIAYPVGSSREKWLADAKVIGIEPCPF